MPAGSERVREIVFTVNNYDEGDREKIMALEWVSYGVCGKEVAPSTGTPHLQGFLQLTKRMRIKSVNDKLKAAVAKSVWTQAAKGGPTKNLEYCSKAGDFKEWGKPRSQGKRMDLEAAYDAARSDKPMIEVADEHKSAFIRYHRGIEKVRELHNKEQASEWREVKTTLHTGPTGCGKTRTAMASAERVYKIQGDQLKWWDGYEGEDTIVIDEYSNDVKVTTLLSFLDGYKLRLPIKGGFTYARWTKVHITTNLFELHEQAKDAHRDALARRITKTISYWESAGISAMAKTYAADE